MSLVCSRSAKERIENRRVSITTITMTRMVSETIASMSVKPRRPELLRNLRDIVDPLVPAAAPEVEAGWDRAGRNRLRCGGDGDDPGGSRPSYLSVAVGELVRELLPLHGVGPGRAPERVVRVGGGPRQVHDLPVHGFGGDAGARLAPDLSGRRPIAGSRRPAAP